MLRQLLQLRWYGRIIAGILLFGALGAWPRTGICQTPGAQPGPPAAPDLSLQYKQPLTDILGREKVYRLSLREAVNLTLENDLDISIASISPRIQGQAIVEAEANFDPVFTASTNYGKDVDPNAYNKHDADGNVIPGFVIDPTKRADWVFDGKISQNLISGGNVFLEYSFDREDSKGSAIGIYSYSRPLNPSWDGNLKMQIQQPLLRGAGIDVTLRNIRITQNRMKRSQLDFVKTVMDAMVVRSILSLGPGVSVGAGQASAGSVNFGAIGIIQSYWNLVLRREELSIIRASLQRAEILMRNNEVRVRAGAMAPIELKVAQAEVAAQQENVIISENNVRNAERLLKQFMNVEKLSIMKDTGLIPKDFPRLERKVIDEAYCIETALRRDPDYEQVKIDLENAKIDVKYTRNGLWPQVDFIGSINLNGLQSTLRRDNDMMFDGNFYDLFLGLQLTVPLNGNRAAKARNAAAQLSAAQLLRSLKSRELQIVKDIRDTVSTVETNAKRVDTTRVARELRQERLDAAEKQLEVGRITSFEVVTAQEDLAGAQLREINAITDYTISLAVLSRLMATILDEMGVQVEEAPILR